MSRVLGVWTVEIWLSCVDGGSRDAHQITQNQGCLVKWEKKKKSRVLGSVLTRMFSFKVFLKIFFLKKILK